MSRRPTIEEDFDDDTDLPLPSHPLPNTGSRGPLIEELHISDDEFDFPSQHAGPASPPRASQQQQQQQQQLQSQQQRPPDSSRPKNAVTDITPYKTWTCIYPIYVDAKRPYGTGQRRVQRPKSLWWPLSKDIAEAANRLGLGTLHEVNKSHPRDWENPGRVRVQWKKDGRLMNPAIKTKKQLLEMICMQIQLLKPENIPKQPYNTQARPQLVSPAHSIENAPANTTPSASAKGKAPATGTKSKSSPAAAPPPKTTTAHRRLPIPPEPHPPLGSRVSPYSPAVSSGVLVETVKAGMSATEGGAGAVGGPGGGAGQGGAGMQKGKRKVVRVRG